MKKLQKISIVSLLVACISTVFVLPSMAFETSDFMIMQQVRDPDGLSAKTYVPMEADVRYRLHHDYITAAATVLCISDTGVKDKYHYSSNGITYYAVPSNSPLVYDFTISIHSSVANDLTEYYGLKLSLVDVSGSTFVPFDYDSPYINQQYSSMSWGSGSSVDVFNLRFTGIYQPTSSDPIKLQKLSIYLEPFLDKTETYDLYITFHQWSFGEYTISQGNLSDVESGQAQVDQAISNISKVQGVGHQPSVNLNSIYSSGDFKDFLRNADELYSLPIISSMVGITCTFSVLFFLLKKR